jgi:hypothetical protein
MILDVCHYDNNIAGDYPETAGSIKPATLTWVLSILADAKTEGKQVITLMHHGMLEHYDMHATFLGNYVISDWQDISEQLADAGIKVVFTDHSHAQDVTRKITRKGNVINDVQTGSLVTYPSPYRVVEISDGETLTLMRNTTKYLT